MYIRRNCLQRLWQLATSPKSIDEDEARQEYMTKVLLSVICLVSHTFTLISAFGAIFHLIPLDTVIILAGVSLFTIAGWFFSHKGYWRQAGFIPSFTLFVAAAYGNYVGGIDAPAMIIYGLAILIGAILKGIRFQFLVLVCSLVCYFSLGFLHHINYLPPARSVDDMFINRISIVIATLTTISLSIWFLIHQYQQAIHNARVNEENLRAIFETVIDGIVLSDLSGIIIKCNEALATILKFDSPQAMIGKKFIQFIDQEDHSRINEFFSDIQKFQHNQIIECQGFTPKHEDYYLELNAALYRDETGKPAGFVSIIRDITKRKKEDDEITRLNRELDNRVKERTLQLEITNKELEAFSYSVSHDLRAPLRHIEGFIEILNEDFSSNLNTQAQDYLNRITASSKRMEELIDNLLRLSRVSRIEIRRENVDLSIMAEQITADLLRLHPEKKTTVIIGKNLTCSGDSQLLRVLLENILANSWKFTSKKQNPKIEFNQLESQQGKIFFVRDNGAGFDMKYRDNLFVPFQRLHKESDFSGTGIGLATAQRIISRHGGKIWAESIIDEGATFFFTINENNDIS